LKEGRYVGGVVDEVLDVQVIPSRRRGRGLGGAESAGVVIIDGLLTSCGFGRTVSHLAGTSELE
jgi:hypothetical protein